MSALPPKADIVWHRGNVRFVSIADIGPYYSITSSAATIPCAACLWRGWGDKNRSPLARTMGARKFCMKSSGPYSTLCIAEGYRNHRNPDFIGGYLVNITTLGISEKPLRNTLEQTGENCEETNSDDHAWRCRYARHSYNFIRETDKRRGLRLRPRPPDHVRSDGFASHANSIEIRRGQLTIIASGKFLDANSWIGHAQNGLEEAR